MSDTFWRLTSARDLGDRVRDLRPDAAAAGLIITDTWCRERMLDHGLTRYEDITPAVLDSICDAVDTLADGDDAGRS